MHRRRPPALRPSLAGAARQARPHGHVGGGPVIVVRWIRAFARFWIDFILGGDWTVAATVLGAILVPCGLVRWGNPTWWFLPATVIGIPVVSLRRVTKEARRP